MSAENEQHLDAAVVVMRLARPNASPRDHERAAQQIAERMGRTDAYRDEVCATALRIAEIDMHRVRQCIDILQGRSEPSPLNRRQP